MSLIAVFSGDHSSAEEIVQQVADRLSYRVVARELLEEAAREFNVAEDKLARALTGSRGFFNTLTRELEKSLIYTRAALAQLLRTDEQIYHGPATHLIPEAISHVLRVGVVADQAHRIAQAQAAGLGADEARSRARKNDEELAQWTQLIHSSEPWDPDLYDILIPIPDTSVERAVELICASVEKEALKPTDRSIQAVLDYQLATGLNVSLLDRGHANCEVTADAGKVTVVVNQGAASPGKLARTVKALRYDKIEAKILEVCAAVEGVDKVEVRPGAGYDHAERPTRTLLVDDEREYVMTLSERLDVRDIPSDVVYDGKQALTFVNTDVPDVMVLDLKMPGMDGMEVLRQTKQDHPDVEVIIVTGHGSDEDERLARELGAFDFLKKPVDINVLAARIKEASSKARGETEEQE
jgi:two-component system, OmpR family, response regulator CpxR